MVLPLIAFSLHFVLSFERACLCVSVCCVCPKLTCAVMVYSPRKQPTSATFSKSPVKKMLRVRTCVPAMLSLLLANIARRLANDWFSKLLAFLLFSLVAWFTVVLYGVCLVVVFSHVMHPCCRFFVSRLSHCCFLFCLVSHMFCHVQT